MALSDHDGNTHSHLKANDADTRIPGAGQPGQAQLPDRGRWVAPPPGQAVRVEPQERGLKLDPPLQVEHLATAEFKAKCGDFRVAAFHALGHLLEHQPMVAEQRRTLERAIGVLEELA